jgi:DNA polymerase I-like protein with 3'-5' exonuclease and polymerase domains
MDFPRIECSEIGLDYETTGLEYWKPDFSVFGVAVATADQEWYFDVRRDPGLAAWLRDLLPGRTVIAHNAQYEYQCTRTFGVDPRSINWYCTMVAECLIYEHNLTYDLESVASYRGVAMKKSYWLDQMQAAMGLRSHAEVLARLSAAPPHMVRAYGSGDARACFDICLSQRPEIEKQELQRVVNLEMQLLPVLADMSWRGVRVNLEAAHAAIPALNVKEVQIASRIKELTGCKDPAVFVNSPKQMREFFKPEPVSKFQWRLIDGTLVGPTKSGKGPSLGQDALRQITHPLATEVLDLRKTIKLRDTFIRGHVIASADRQSYVHTQFNQTRNDEDAGTVTGRLSSTGPALQQITKRDKANAAILRALFLPDEGHDWFCADYSQVDFRCAAHLIKAPDILEAYRANPSLDYHQVVSDMTGIPRNPAYAGAPNTKQINLGLAFGAGAGKLAFMMGMPYEVGEWRKRMVYYPGPEAKKVFDTYHAKLPGVKEFMKHAESVAKVRGYVRTLTGRRLRFFSTGGEHKAAGLLYQSYAADLHKIGLVRTDNLLRESAGNQGSEAPARLLVSVHDEIGVSINPASELGPLIIREYTDFNSDSSWVKMRVPIKASGDYGINWWEASKG